MTHNVDARIVISREAQQLLLQDVRQRRTIEACGLLLGCSEQSGDWNIESVHPLQNIHNSPSYFEFAPEELLQAELTHPGEIVGVYHSHPTGYPTASSTDRDTMRRVNVEQRIPWAWLIITGPFDDICEQLQIIAYYHDDNLGLREIAVTSA